MRTLKTLSIIFAFLFLALAEASTGISYHGRLMLPSGESVKTLTQFRIQIRTPGNENCLMYEETTSRDLSLTDGVFSITIADGTGSRTDTLGLGLDAIFANRSKFVFTENCAIVSDYTPNFADGRRLQVSFNDGTFAGWEDLPVQNIGFSPISIESLQVGGFKASHLLRVADGAGVPQNVAALTPAYFNELVALAAGTSTVYAKAGVVSGNDITSGTIGGSTVIDTTGTIKATSVSAATGGFNTVDVWKADNSNKVSLRASASQSANYILTLPVDDGGAGQILSTDGSGVLSWTNATSIGAASGDVSGTYPALTVIKIQGQGVSATTPTTGQAFVFDGTNWAGKNFGIGDLRTAAGATQFASAACTAAQTLTWSSLTDAFSCSDITGLVPTSLAAGGVAGQILKIDGSGDLSWAADDTGGAGTPAGADHDIQFNNAGAVGGSNTLSFIAPGTLFVGTRPTGYSTDGNIYMYSGTSARSNLTLRNTSTGNTTSDGASVAQVFNDLIISNYENGYMSFVTNNLERVRILANGSVGIGTTTPGEKLEVAGKVKATELCIGADCKAAWPAAGGSGTVTEVTSANAYLTVATGTTVPALTLNVGAVANTVAAGDDARFTDSRAPNGNAGGDLTGTYPDPTIAKISGNAITAGTIAGADIGKVYRWSGTELTPAFLNFGDLRTAAGAQQLTAACAANEKIQWSVSTDTFTCQSIGSLNASAITAGTIDAARLPASATVWQDGGSNRIYYSAANVGLGIAAPATTLHIVSTQAAATSAPDRAGLIVDGEGTSYGARVAARAFSATEGAVYGGYRSLGPKSALAGVTSGKGLVSLVGYGYDGSGWSSNSSSPGITLESSETWSGTAKGSRIVFGTTANTTTAVAERMRIDHNGYVGIGTGASAPSYMLHVNGTFGANSIEALDGGIANLTTMVTTSAGSIPGSFNMVTRNTSTSGYSGLVMADAGGTIRGFLAYSNSAAAPFNSTVGLASADTSTPIVFGIAGFEVARFKSSNGYYGIGTNDPQTRLHVYTPGAGAVAGFQNDTGSCTVTPNTSSLSCSSDIRLKKNIEVILGLDALNKVINLQAKSYQWKTGDDGRHIGYIAQEVEKIVPELVVEGANGFKQVSYSGFVPLLSEAIKEVHAETQEQKRQISSIADDKKALEKEVAELKKKNAALEARLKKIEQLLSK